MRIVMLIEAWTPIWGGGQEVCLQLALHLVANHACEVDIVTMNLQEKKGERRQEKEKKGKGCHHVSVEELAEGVRLCRVGKVRSFGFVDRLAWWRDVSSFVCDQYEERPYDLLYAHANLPGVPAKFLGWKLGLPVVYQVHGSGVKAMKQMYGCGCKTYALLAVEYLVQRLFCYDLLLSVDRKFLEGFVGSPRALFVPNGVDLGKWEPKDRQTKQKQDGLQFLFVGRLHPQKGLRYLIDAVGHCSGALRKKNAHFVIVGEGDLLHDLQQQARDVEVDDLFVWKGFLVGQDLVDVFHASDVFVLPSLFEGFPLVVLEAWAAGLPVLVTEVGELPSVVDHGVNGWLVKPGDVDALAAQLGKCIEMDAGALHLLGSAGEGLVATTYSWTGVVARLSSLLEDLVA